MSILRVFGPEHPEMSSTDISRTLGMSKATAHRLLQTLEDGRLLERDAITRRYRIGPQMYVLGSLYLETNDLLKAAQPVVKTVNALCGETTNLGIYEKGFSVLVMREESAHGFRWDRHIGSSVPAYVSAIGLAILSEFSVEEIDRVYPGEELRSATSRAIGSKTELLRRLQEIRRSGVAFNQGGVEGVEGIGVAVRGRDGSAVAGLAIALPIFRIDDLYRARLASLVTKAAGLISYRMGYLAVRSHVSSVQELSDWWTNCSGQSSVNVPVS